MTQTAYIDTICKRFKQWIGPNTGKIDTPWLVGPAGRMSLLMSPSTDAEREAMAKIPYP